MYVSWDSSRKDSCGNESPTVVVHEQKWPPRRLYPRDDALQHGIHLICIESELNAKHFVHRNTRELFRQHTCFVIFECLGYPYFACVLLEKTEFVGNFNVVENDRVQFLVLLVDQSFNTFRVATHNTC